MEQVKTSQLVKRIFGFSMASWIGATINFFVLPISTRIFSTGELAKINLFYSIVTVLLSFTCFGFDQGYVRYFSGYGEEDRKNLFSVCLNFSLVIVCLCTLLALPFQAYISKWIVDDSSFPVLVPLLVCLFTQVIYRYLSLYYRMRSVVLSYTLVAVLSSAIVKLSYLIGSVIEPEAKLAIIIMAITSGCFLLGSLVSLRTKVSLKVKIRKYVNKDFLKYCIPLIPVTFIVQINTYTPQYAIRFTNNFDDLGVFSTAVTLSSILTLVQSGVNVFWTPFVFENYRNGKTQIWKMQRLISIVLVGCAIGIITFKDLIVLILGSDYRGAIGYLPLLIVSPAFATLGELTGVGTLLNKKGYLNLIITSVALIFNIFFSWSFTRLWGAIGAALSSAMTASVLFALKTYFGQREYNSTGDMKHLIFCIMCLVVVVILNTVYTNPISFVGVVNFLIILVLLFALFKEIKEMRKAEKE